MNATELHVAGMSRSGNHAFRELFDDEALELSDAIFGRIPGTRDWVRRPAVA